MSLGRVCRCDKPGKVICRVGSGGGGGEDVVDVVVELEVVVEYANQPAIKKSKQKSVAKRSRVCKDKKRKGRMIIGSNSEH